MHTLIIRMMITTTITSNTCHARRGKYQRRQRRETPGPRGVRLRKVMDRFEGGDLAAPLGRSSEGGGSY